MWSSSMKHLLSKWLFQVCSYIMFMKAPLTLLSPSVHIQILQTDLHIFPLRISWENLIKHQDVFSFMIIFYILTTLSLDNVWISLGENCCWSPLGLKGVTHSVHKNVHDCICLIWFLICLYVGCRANFECQ